MPFGATDDQRLALLIDTQANLEGVKAATAATTQFASTVKGVAATTASASAATAGATVSAEKLVAATEAAGAAHASMGTKVRTTSP